MFLSNELYVNDVNSILKLDLDWKKLENSSILITGATGMIGTFLVDVLMERNHQFQSNISIYALGRSRIRARERFASYIEENTFQFIEHDINEKLEIDCHFDYIFHCASNTHPRAYAEDPIGTIMTNVLGTENVLKIALKSYAKRVVFLSSVEIYGENRGDTEKFSEDYCGYINCNTLRAGYPEGKRTGEALCQAYLQKYGLNIVIPRICRVFGPTMLNSDSKALAQFINNAVDRKNIILKSKGMQYFSYCYVSDVVAALLYILLQGKNGEAYNIADDEHDIRLKDLAQQLANIAETAVIFELPDEIEKRGYSKANDARLCSDKLKKLGWSTSGSLYSQLQKTVTILSTQKS